MNCLKSNKRCSLATCLIPIREIYVYFKNRLALITGSSSFIDYHVTKLLEQDWKVIGIDNMSIITMYHLKKNGSKY